MTPTAHFPDVSHFEDVASFHAIQKQGGCPLVITKATEGAHCDDPLYQSYAQRARSVPGLLFGAYVFLDAGPALPQTAHFFSTVHLQKGDLQPIVDAEQKGLTRLETFDALKDMERRGYRPILYCSLDFFVNILGSPTRWWLWLAAYRDTLPTLPPGVKLFAWQHTLAGTCPGIKGPVDMSYLYVPVADLPEFCV